MKKIYFFLLLLLCLCAYNTEAQVADSLASSVKGLPDKYYAKVDKKLNDVNEKLTKKSIKYLAKFKRQEQKLQEKLAKLDSNQAKNLLAGADGEYQELSQKIKSKTAFVSKFGGGSYISNMDSLGTSLSFLKQLNGLGDKVKDPLKSFDALQGKLHQSDKIKEFIAQRKDQIKQALSKFTNLPSGLKNQYTKLNKTAYYYSAQVKEYKDMLKDPEKVEKQALSVLSKVPAFQKFWQKNSYFSALFPVSSTPVGTPASTAGLQTKASVQGIIAQRVGSLAGKGASPIHYFKQQVGAAQAQLSQLKDKINKLSGGSNGDMTMPKFKPNEQKTKPFLQRLEYGFNIQNAASRYNIPTISDLALTLGYKLSDNKRIGLGASYKIGLGNGFKDIHLSSQGIGLRSYLDVKTKGNIWITGGFESNYFSAFNNIRDLKNDIAAWQQSVILGISKKYKVGKKNGNMQLLYDFLHNNHNSPGQAIKFRVGYIF